MAARFWIGGGTNANWNASPTTNWAATSGGTTRVAAPTSADDVTFDGVGVNANTASTQATTTSILSLNITSGYTSTITFNAQTTVAGNVTFGANMTIAGTALMIVSAASTITSNGKTYLGSMTLSAAATYTLTGLLTVTGTLSLTGGSVTFAGSGFTVGTFSCNFAGAATITLVNTVTYTINTAFNAQFSRTGSILLFTSDHATNKAILTLAVNATCNVLASFTRIDASNGRPIRTFNGTITTCTNIFVLTDLITTSIIT